MKQLSDPHIFQENRLPAHAEMEIFICDKSSGSESRATSNRIINLDGGSSLLQYDEYEDDDWAFSYADNPAAAKEGFEAEDYEPIVKDGWSAIKVPAHIQMEDGRDKPHYTNTAYPWDGKEALERGETPSQFNPVGSYIRYFEVPSAYAGKQLRISFQGVESAAAVWLNGSYVGYFENSFDPAEFDITPYVKTGKNKLAVRVFKWCAGSWCEDQDFFRFSGIYRSVYIYYVPEVHLEDIRIRALLDDDYINGRLAVEARLSSPGGVRLRLLDTSAVGLTAAERTEQVYGLAQTKPEKVLFDSGVVSGVSSTENCGDPTKVGSDDPASQVSGQPAGSIMVSAESPDLPSLRLWSAEQPNLYTLLIEVTDEQGKVVERTTQRVGFRRFEIRDGLMCINGKRIVFKGVNRHEFSSQTGRIVSDEELLQDIVTMKQNNINAIRTSHYPNDVKIYDMCDEYGLYLIAENNMETHGTWNMYDPLVKAREEAAQRLSKQSSGDNPISEDGQTGVADPGSAADQPALTFNDWYKYDVINKYADEIIDRVIPGDDDKWEPLLLDRVNSCYQRDKNHPCILIWSIGNESFGGKVPQHMTDLFHKLDPDRLVHYEGIFHDRRYPDTSDIESQMYPSVADIEAFLSEHREKPFICCEYTHAMGNSCGGMHKYTDLTEREPLYQGGFIWDYIDQSIESQTMYGEDCQLYGGDFGERPTSYEFSGNGIVYGADRTPSPKMQEVKYNYQSIHVEFADGRMIIRNRNLFTSTDVYDCVITWLHEGKEIERTTIPTAVAPLSEEEYDLPFYGEEKEPGEYAIIVSFRLKDKTIWGYEECEMAFDQFIYTVEEDEAAGSEQATVTGTQSGISAYGASTQQLPHKPLEVIIGEENVGVRGKDFEVLFSGDKRGLVSYIYKGKQFLSEPPRPNFWRAPTDNDRGAGSDFDYAQWKIASLYQKPRDEGTERPMYPWSEAYIEKYGDRMGIKDDGTFIISFDFVLATTPMAEVTVTYTVHQDGQITIAMDHTPVEGLPEMPEFGLMFTLDPELTDVRWYGLGKEETYADRKRGGKIGIWHKKVRDCMARYLVPQECGNHEDVRWMSVLDSTYQYGLKFKATQSSMCASALFYTPHQLEEAKHIYELPKPYHTIVRTSLAQMGVGGDDSWGAKVHPEYHLDVSRPMHFEVTLEPCE